MVRKVPQDADFASHITLSVVPAPSPSSSARASTAPQNILILLHGLGDTHASFTSLGRSLNLADTTCLSVRAPMALPLGLSAPGPDGSFHWGDDVIFDPARPDGGMDVEGAGYARAVRLVAQDIVRAVLLGKCGYAMRDIVIMGMGQGGTVALGVACVLAPSELGGVVSLGGGLPEEYRHKRGDQKSMTPVLLTYGKASSAITSAKVQEIKDAFATVESCQWERAGDGMARNMQEMLPIMKFFARRLRTEAPRGTKELP